MILVALMLACREPPATSPSPAPEALAEGWVQALVLDPARFAETVDGSGRAGWVALHRGDWATAAELLPAGLPAARAELEQALVAEDLARLGAVAWPMLLDRWRQTDPTIDGSLLPLLAAMATADVAPTEGDAEAAVDPAVQAWLAATRQPSAASLADLPKLADPLAAKCLQADLALRAGTRDALPAPCADGPPFGGGDGPILHDPLLSGSAAIEHRRRADELAGGSLAEALQRADLEALLFSSWWSRDDLAAELSADPALSNPGAVGPTLTALDLPAAGDADDPQAARERARALTRAVDDWVERLRTASSTDGQALLDDLQLATALRNRVLVAWAREALRAGHPHQATAYLLLAHDLEDAGNISATNPPALFVLQAEAFLRTGRTRQALDALSALDEDLPGLTGTIETIGDLAVLEGMGRHGDSKED
ncbi:MAG: hypothetical protein D6798_08685 [Deltaproteobacteria bacterium]|nr:MAG: hypothetical protein D6798_08685 [Deltaproteobacteria bacterium]